MEQVGNCVTAPNVLPGGDFEDTPQRKQEAWKLDEQTLDEVELTATRESQIVAPVGEGAADAKKKGDGKKDAEDGKDPAVPKKTKGKRGPETRPDVPHEGKQCAKLEIKAKNPKAVPQALERTLLAITSPPVQLQPGTLVQISGWVCIPAPITATADGALFYDSICGEPFAIRLTEPTPWKKFTVYRRVPASGTVQVTLALTGIGTVYFDDVRIEPLVPGAGPTAAKQK